MNAKKSPPFAPLLLRRKTPAGNCFIRAVALCPAKRRFAFSPMGSHARLAAEIPDIFLPLARNENSGMTMIFLPLRINALFVLGGSFTRSPVVKLPLPQLQTRLGVSARRAAECRET